MTKQLIALAIAAAFGIAHAADVKPAVEAKPAAAPTATVVKAEPAKADVKAPEAKPTVAAPETKVVKKTRHAAKKAEHKTAPMAPVVAKAEAPKAEPAKVEAPKAAESAKK